MAAVRLPPVRERKRPNGDGFSSRPMIRTRKGGASERGAPGGKPRRGKPRPRTPRRAKQSAALRQQKRPQRRARSPAGDVTFRASRGMARTLGAPHSPRAQRAEEAARRKRSIYESDPFHESDPFPFMPLTAYFNIAITRPTIKPNSIQHKHKKSRTGIGACP